MIHAYHVVISMYGFRLPNDPRGSWSDFVRKWELVRFGKSQRQTNLANPPKLTEAEVADLQRARESLTYPAVSLTGQQALGIASGFAKLARRNGYTIYACSILPEHTHLVIGRHNYRVEQIVNLLKGAATRSLIEQGIHPLGRFAKPNKRPPRMWSSKQWKVYLDDEEAIENAIRYVIDNPPKEGKPQQHWSFTTPFPGIPIGGWTTYH